MTLQERFDQIKAFALRAIGALPGDAQGGSLPARIIRVGHLLFRGYADDDLTIHAASLTFVTLTSLVPILAVGFALLKGFGMGAEQLNEAMQMEWLAHMPAQFQEFVEQLLRLVNTTNFSALGWIGLVFFVLTAVLLLANVEKSFNRVWGVDKSRSLLRQVTNYTSVLVLVPLLIGVAGGLKAQIAINRKFFDLDV
ncbi:MAG: YihY/virulence factor BrkB family protein, partial [Kiritimatiellia bacterium]